MRAGVTDRLIPLVKKATKQLDKQLEAKRTQFFAFEGKVVDERECEDNTAVQGAIQKAYELADVLRPRTDPTGGARPVVIQIQWPSWASPPKDVTPPPAIEAEATVVG